MILALTLLAGCGYHSYSPSTQYTFDVPFIKGDKDGQLTAQVIQALSKSPFLKYDVSQPQVKIIAKILNNEAQQIGYQYRMKDNDAKVEHRLVPNEGRRLVKVEFTLEGFPDRKSYLVQIEGTSDYDFVDPDSFKDLAFYSPSGQLATVLDFSLGQLDSEEGAKLASFSPCYEKIAYQFKENLDRYLFSLHSEDKK